VGHPSSRPSRMPSCSWTRTGMGVAGRNGARPLPRLRLLTSRSQRLPVPAAARRATRRFARTADKVGDRRPALPHKPACVSRFLIETEACGSKESAPCAQLAGLMLLRARSTATPNIPALAHSQGYMREVDVEPVPELVPGRPSSRRLQTASPSRNPM